MLYDEIQSMLSSLLADTSTNFYTASEREQAVNRSCQYINAEAMFLRDVKRIPVLPTDEYVPLPGDFSGFATGVDWTEAGVRTALSYLPVYRLRSNNVDWDTQVGTPQYITQEGGMLYLSPWPTRAGVVTLPYVPLPNYLNKIDEPAMFADPRFNSFGELIAYRSAWDLLMKDRDFDAADRFMRTFKERFIDFKESLRRGPESVQPFYNNVYGGS